MNSNNFNQLLTLSCMMRALLYISDHILSIKISNMSTHFCHFKMFHGIGSRITDKKINVHLYKPISICHKCMHPVLNLDTGIMLLTN